MTSTASSVAIGVAVLPGKDVMQGARDPLALPVQQEGNLVQELMPPAPSISEAVGYIAQNSAVPPRAQQIARIGPLSSANDRTLKASSVKYFDDGQVDVLLQTQTPPDLYSHMLRNVGGKMWATGGTPSGEIQISKGASDVHAAVGSPVMTTAVGVPVIDVATAGVSKASVEFDAWQGIKSGDARVQTDLDEMMLFFNTHNTRPVVSMRVEAFHFDKQIRQEADTQLFNGNDGQEFTTTNIQVADFVTSIDLTYLIFPFGYLQSVDEKGPTVKQLFEKFAKDGNMLKALEMSKEVHFDFEALAMLVKHFLSAVMGVSVNVDVTFPMMNKTVRIYSKNCCSSMVSSSTCSLGCQLLCVPYVCTMLYRGDCGGEQHVVQDIRSVFKILYEPSQVLELIIPQLRAGVPNLDWSALAGKRERAAVDLVG